MGNPLRGEVSFEAGDKAYTVTFNVNVFCELEAATGLDLDELIANLNARNSLTLLRQVFCAALQPKHPGASIADTGEIMSDIGADGMRDVLSRALEKAMPEPEVEDDAARPPNRKERRATAKKRSAGTG